MAPSWDPEWVLDIYPRDGGFHCVGTTRQGLPCKNSFIRREYLRQANMILDELPELAQCRTRQVALLDDLHDLAWYTLCPRWHQSRIPQADTISRRWLRTILDLEIINRGERRTPSTRNSSTASSSTSSDSSHGPSRGNSSNRLPSSAPTLAFSLGSHTSRSNTLRGTSSSSGSQSSGPSIGPLYPASRQSSVGPRSVTNSSPSWDSDTGSSGSTHTMRASTHASNTASSSTVSPRARTRQHWANHSVLPRINTQVANSSRGGHQHRPVLLVTPEERNNSRRSDAPSPSSSSVSSSIVTLDISPMVVPQNRQTNILRASAPVHDEYQLLTPARTPDIVRNTIGTPSQHPRVSTSSSSSSSLPNTSASNHVIHLNLNLNVTVSGRRDRSTSGTESPTPPSRHSRNTNSVSNSVTRYDRGSPSSSPSAMSAAETITELLAALEEVVARFNSRSIASSPSTLGRRPHDSLHTPRSETDSPETPITPDRVRNTPSSPYSPSELSLESPVIVHTAGSSGSSSPVLVSTPRSSGSETPVFVSP